MVIVDRIDELVGWARLWASLVPKRLQRDMRDNAVEAYVARSPERGVASLSRGGIHS